MIPSFGLIIVGDEILSGKRADKHLAKVIELLAARGLAFLLFGGLLFAEGFYYRKMRRADVREGGES